MITSVPVRDQAMPVLAVEVPRLVLIDSSVWMEALHHKGRPVCHEAVLDAVASNVAATCEVVIAEVLQGARDDAHAEELREHLDAVIELSMRGAGEIAAGVSRSLRGKGLVFAMSDLLICGVAATHDAALMHRDRHLSALAQAAGIEEIVVG